MRMGSTPGRSGAIFGNFAQRIYTDLLDLKRDGIGALRQFLRGGNIVPLPHDGLVRSNKACWALGFGIHNADAITHGARGHGGHSA